MKKYFAFICLGFIISSYIGLGFVNVAKAECKYDVKLDISPSATTRTATLTFTTTVKIVGGSLGDCAKNVSFVYKLQSKNGWEPINGLMNASSMKAGVYNNTQAVHNATLSLNTLYGILNKNNDYGSEYESINIEVVNLNSLVFAVNAYNDQFLGAEIGSAGKTVSVSGSSGSVAPSGQKNILISFQGFEYAKGENLQVQFEPENIKNTDPEVNVYTYVNTKNIGNFKINLGELSKQTDRVKWQNVVVNEANGFKNGENIIEVVMKPSANLNVIFGRGSGKVTATGLNVGANANNVGAGNTGVGGGGNTGVNVGAGNTGTGAGGVQTSVDTSLKETLFNPLPSDSLTGTLLGIAKGFLAVVGLWGVVFVMIGGFKMVIANGNEEAITAAKKTITWAVLGVVVALLSFSIIAIVQNLLGADIPEPQGMNIIKQHSNV